LIEKVNYQGWPNCYRLANDSIEVIVTTDVGPRVIRLGFIGQPNEFAEIAPMMGQTGGDEFRIYGGHRFWHAPEARPRSYVPDNGPVDIKRHKDYVRLTPPTEAATGIQKEIDVHLSAEKAQVTVVHRLYNRGLWAVELSPWAISLMAAGGRAILPLPPRGPQRDNLLPTSLLAIWPYTDLSDPRFILGSRYIMLRQDRKMPSPQKIGGMISDGWAAYFNRGHLFLKAFDYENGLPYPDFGCSVECFTNDAILELETLGPLTLLEPDEYLEHVEKWFLFRDVPEPHNDSDIERNILPLLQPAV